MLKYVDDRDDESIIITHIYLLLGVSYGIFYITLNNIQVNFINIYIG
jgi:hypothetical protein